MVFLAAHRPFLPINESFFRLAASNPTSSLPGRNARIPDPRTQCNTKPGSSPTCRQSSLANLRRLTPETGPASETRCSSGFQSCQHGANAAGSKSRYRNGNKSEPKKPCASIRHCEGLRGTPCSSYPLGTRVALTRRTTFFQKKMYLRSCLHKSDESSGLERFIFSLLEDSSGGRRKINDAH